MPMTPSDAPPIHAEAPQAEARGDLRGALGWIALGIAIVVASLRMDRLEQQDVNPYTVPGLLPGLLGIAMTLLGSLLAMRSWRHGARLLGEPALALDRAAFRRLALVLGLCLLFGVGLVGHGLPFWLSAALYVSVAIVSLQGPRRTALGRKVSLRDAAVAITIGLGAGAAITLVFQQIFLVRLP